MGCASQMQVGHRVTVALRTVEPEADPEKWVILHHQFARTDAVKQILL